MKKIVISCALISIPFIAYAAEQQSYSIEVVASVPDDSFYVMPVDGGWINEPQAMDYDYGTQRLRSIEKDFQYKSTLGGIQAYLTNTDSAGSSILSNGQDTIPLKVSFNGIALSSSTSEVVSESAAKNGGRTNLRIEQKDEKPLTVSGSFNGQVALMFEPALSVEQR